MSAPAKKLASSLLVDSAVVAFFSTRHISSGQPKPAVTIRRNHRSRWTRIVGHDPPEWAVTINQNRRSR